MKRVAVRFAYLGDGFSGSQIQPEVRTVEGEMRAASTRSAAWTTTVWTSA